MAVARVRIAVPPGTRSCGDLGPNRWEQARDARGAIRFMSDLEGLKRRFPSEHSRDMFLEQLRELMKMAADAALPWDMVVQMQVAPDVLELKLPDWYYSGGKMHTRLYFSEPFDLPGTLVALRLLTKRPGPIGLPEQDEQAKAASDLLLEFRNRGYY